MDKFFHSRLFRCLVCLVLVCCILVNASPIRAKAVTPVALTGWAILALTAALGAGVVLNPATPQVANAIGEEFKQKVGDISVSFHPELLEKVKKLSDHLDNMTPEWDPGDFHNDLKTALAGGLLTAITAMIVAAVVDGVVNTEVEEEVTAPDGYAYFNGHLLPAFPEYDSSEYPYALVVWNSYHGGYQVYLSQLRLFSTSGQNLCNLNEYDNYYLNDTIKSNAYNWELSSSYFLANYLPSAKVYTFLWANYDITNEDGSKVFLEASSMPATEYISTTTVPVTPEIYVGDIPSQIENGETDEEKLNIPIIDPSKFVTSPDTAYEEITNVAQQMKDGTMTYNQYVNNYQYVPTGP